jgi:hypothetical protein
MQVLEKRSLKNSATWKPSLRSLRPLRETHSVSPLEHFPTPNSEEPNFLTLQLFNPIASHHPGERSGAVVMVPLHNSG